MTAPTQIYVGDLIFLRDKLAREQARADQIAADRDALEQSLSATRGQVTKLRKRVSAGVCPCCNRTFQNLGRHMKTKHPEFGGDAA